MAKAQLILVCILILGFYIACPAQQVLGKDEIYNDWVRSHPTSVNCDTMMGPFSFDAKIEAQIQTTIRSLQAGGVDTILVLVNAHPGTLYADTCRPEIYPADVFVFWRVGGRESFRKIPDKCGLGEFESACSSIFYFFTEHQHQLEGEYIMPVILGAKRKNNQISYELIISSDEDEYVLYYSIHGHCKRFAFSQSDITNKSSLFYSDNIESQVYKWFVALKQACSGYHHRNQKAQTAPCSFGAN